MRGLVTVDGKPLVGGRVQFAPVASGDQLNAGKPGFGDIAADGTYGISTYGRDDGAVVADHWVTIINNTGDQGVARQLLGARRVTVPRRKTVVSGQENVISIDLTANEIKRFGEGAD